MAAMTQATVTAALTEAIRLGAIGVDAVKLIALAAGTAARPLDLAAYPQLPRPAVRTTSASDYAAPVRPVSSSAKYVSPDPRPLSIDALPHPAHG